MLSKLTPGLLSKLEWLYNRLLTGHISDADRDFGRVSTLEARLLKFLRSSGEQNEAPACFAQGNGGGTSNT